MIVHYVVYRETLAFLILNSASDELYVLFALHSTGFLQLRADLNEWHCGFRLEGDGLQSFIINLHLHGSVNDLYIPFADSLVVFDGGQLIIILYRPQQLERRRHIMHSIGAMILA